ncbi:Predicted dienelactone hydrolase [Paracoccus halophilus]|nr:Predicted dienelactone hydrolase [Paracoccus halophilus]
MNGTPEGSGLPMVLLSHGNGGWMGGHADTALALAEAGYVAVALTHPGDNGEDESASPSEWLISRPADISETIDYMLSDWTYADRIDPGRVGVFGFSAGAYTALVVAGAVPGLTLARQRCFDVPDEFTCGIGMLDDVDPAELGPRLRDVAGDDRVSAVSAAAPGLGYGFDKTALADVSVPVQIWSGAIDDRVPHDTNGANIAANLPNMPEVHVVENAGHFAFLAECDPRLREINPEIWNMVCVDADGFDRAAFHQLFNKKIIEFFDSSLPRPDRQ